MKKNNLFKKLIVCVIVCFGLFFGMFMTENNVVLAETIDDELGDEIVEEPDTLVTDQIYDDLIRNGYSVDLRTDMEDSHLYSALLQIVKDYIKDTYSYTYTNSTLYSTMFKSFKEITIGEMSITNLKGLEKFKFSELETLSITNNDIASIDKEIFASMPKLKTLNLSCNNIKNIDLSLATGLQTINLSSNNLETIDFSNLESQNLDINLAGNKFSDMKKIFLPTRVNSIDLNIIANNIIDIDQEYFDYDKLSMKIGLQGLYKQTDLKIDTNASIKYFKIGDPSIELKVYKINPLEDVLVKTISDSSITGNNTHVNINELSVGDYYIEFVSGGNKLYKEGDSEYNYFNDCKFTVIPSACTFKFEYKGKIYDNLNNKVTGKVKVFLEAEEGAKIMYKLNNQDWQEGAEVLCENGGNYTILAKVVIGDYESETKSILVRTSLNTVIPDGLMLVLILLFSIVLFAVVVPLVSKKWFRNSL